MKLSKKHTLGETGIPPVFIQEISMKTQEEITGGDGTRSRFSVDVLSTIHKDDKGRTDKFSCTIVDFNGDVDNSNRLFDGWGAASHL